MSDYIEDWVATGGVTTLSAPSRVDVPMGVVFASIKGGVYACTTAELDNVLNKHYTPTGSKLRRLVVAKSNALDDNPETHAETAAFYADASPFELAVGSKRMGFKGPGIEFPELPDCTGLIAAGERLMNVAAEELPRLTDALTRLAEVRERDYYGPDGRSNREF
jgi:hypothetical protein